MKKINILILLFLIIISCKSKIEKKENKCTSKKIESVFLDEYLIKTDSCNTFQKFPKVEYFSNGKLLMSGYSERNYKQGEWSFYNENGIKKNDGNFENSQPKGIWSFSNLGNINWQIFNNVEQKYLLSIPNDWKLIQGSNTESIAILNKNSKSEIDYDLKFIITSLKTDELEETINALYKRTVEEFEKTFINVKHKKVDITDFEEVYEIQYSEIINEKKYLNSELIYNHQDRFYLLSTSINQKGKNDYSIIKEIMKTSFKVYKK